MKYKTTKQCILNSYRCIKVGYCQLQSLLHFMEPNAYTTRREGWAADVYDIGDGIAIVTGYAPFGAVANYKLCRKYEEKARKILYRDNRYKTIDGKRKAIEKLIQKFREEAIQ